MVDYKKALYAATGITAIGYGLGWVWHTYFPNGLLNLSLKFSALPVNVAANVAGQISNGVDTSIAAKLINVLNGVIPIGGQIASIATLFVASFLVVVLAGFFAGKVSMFGKSDTQKFGVGLALSAFVIGLLAGTTSLSLGSLGTGIAMLFYFGIIAVIYSIARTVDVIKDFFPQP
mgnify:CR=1 FL=1